MEIMNILLIYFMDVFGKFGSVLLKGVGLCHFDEFTGQRGLVVHIIVNGMSGKSIAAYSYGIIVFHVFVILSVCVMCLFCLLSSVLLTIYIITALQQSS